jgi:hypothetical protein
MNPVELFEFYTTEFSENWQHLVQQADSRLKDKVNLVTVRGKEKTFNQIGKVEGRKITTRNGKTIPQNHPLAKRWLRTEAWDCVYHEDEWDEQLLGDVSSPASEVITAHGNAYARSCDQTIIDALEGTAYVGPTGVTPVEVPSSQKVPVNYVHGGTGANSGLTLAKLIRAKSQFGKNEVTGQDTVADEKLFLIVSQQQLDDLLNNVNEVRSADFAAVKALVDGEVNNFMGFRFVRSEKLTLDGSDIRTCIAYVQSGIAFASNDKNVRMSIRDDLNETLQIRTKWRHGATRLEEERVVLIYCDESPA